MTGLRRIPNTTLIDGEKIDNLPTDINASLAAKQDTLVSGKNIKTVGGTSLLGSGDINISLTGGVIGPATNTDSYIPQRDGVNTKTLKNGLAVPQGGLAGLTALGNKVEKNAAIAEATKTKITYDAKGLVTDGEDATTADIADSTDKRYVTDNNLTVIANTSGTNTGDETITTIKTKLGAATASVDGYATSTQITKLDGIATGATANAKATGAEVDTGIDDIKYVTAKAIEDSDIAKNTIDINAQTGTTYTLVLGDASKMVTLTNGSAITLTVPTNASVAFPVGTVVFLKQGGAGQVTIGGASVTITESKKKLKEIGAGAFLLKTATDTRTLIGNTVA